MYVLPATGWYDVAGTGFPMGKSDLLGEQGDSRGGRDKSWERRERQKEGIKRKLGGDEKRIIYFYFPCSSRPLTAAQPPVLPQDSAVLGVVLINASV